MEPIAQQGCGICLAAGAGKTGTSRSLILTSTNHHMASMQQLQIREYKLVHKDQIKKDPTNPNIMNKAQMDGLRYVAKRWGYGDPIAIDSTYTIIDGEHRYDLLVEDGQEQIPCIYFPNVVTEIDRKILRQVFNKLRGTHDKKKDAADFRAIFEAQMLQPLADSLATPRDLFEQSLRKHYQIEFGGVETNNIIAIPKKTDIKRGDIFQLGNHKIMCGDCTEQTDIRALFGDAKVDQLNTDPPYGIDYSNKNKYLNASDGGHRLEDQLQNDTIDFSSYRAFIASFLSKVPFAKSNTAYVWASGQRLHLVRQAFDDAQMHFSEYLVWIKNNHVLGRLDHQQKHELCLYGYKGKHEFQGGNSVMSIYNHDKPLANDLHPTMKPVPLIEDHIREGTTRGAIVYDPFVGSGSTMIAAHKSERICYAMDIEPLYVDITIQRLEAFTGMKASKIQASV